MTVIVTPTAWGKLEARFAAAAADGTMPTTLEQLGWIKDGTSDLKNEAGDKLELKEEGGALRDELQKEGKLIFSCTIIGIPVAMRNKFWIMDGTKVVSMVNSKKFAFQICAPEVEGSDTINAPYCTVSMGPLLSSTEGYTSELTVTLLKGPKNYLFDIVPIA